MPTTGKSNSTRFRELGHPARAVVIGGGTGAPISIQALLSLDAEVAAVVTMADDGGSSGLLREYPGILPPGDIRKCLVAMATDPHSPWVEAFIRRLAYDNDHPLGNLMLATLSSVTGSLPQAIELCGQLLAVRGQVYPSTLESVELLGQTVEGSSLSGQAQLTRSEQALASVQLNPDQPEAYLPALQAIRQADLIVLGPGSLFTSIIPNILVPGVLEAIQTSSAYKVFVCSLADVQGETRGMNALQHTAALLESGMEGQLDLVVINQPETASDNSSHIKPVLIDPIMVQQIQAFGAQVCLEPLADQEHPTWHDVASLAAVFQQILDERVTDVIHR